MRDDWHVSEPAAYLIAGFVGEIFDRVQTTSIKSFRRISSLKVRVLPADDVFPPETLVQRASHFALLFTAGFGRALPVGRDEQVAGIMVNVGAPGGSLRIQGPDGAVVKSLTFKWSGQEPSVYFSLLADLARPVRGGPDYVTVEIVRDDIPPTEATVHGVPPPKKRDSEIEIEGVLVLSTQEASSVESVWDCPDLPLDLSALPETC